MRKRRPPNERQRKLCVGGQKQRANRVECMWGEMGGMGGQGGEAPRENERIPGNRSWECCGEDAQDCFKVPTLHCKKYVAVKAMAK